MKKKISFLNLLAVLIVLFTGVYQANAANLQQRSQVLSAANGYPNWYQDANNLALSLCLDLNGFCLVDPTAQPFPANRADISPANFPPEAFYYMADTSGATVGNTIVLTLYEAALEGGFAAAVVDGGQAVFTRIRIRADVSLPGTYTVTHPYGVDTFVIATVDPNNFEINFTEDVPGLVANQFDAPLTSRVGPFLTRADGLFPVDPISGNKYIGIPLQAVAVTGGVGGVNSVTISGPSGTLTLNTFALMGKVLGLVIAPPVDGTDFGFAKLTPAAGVTKTFALTNLTATPFTPVIAANVPNITPVAPSPDFTIVPAGCAVALLPNATCNFDVTFVPLADGLKTATIVVSGPDVPPAQTTVTGTGDGIAPTVALDSLKFFTNSPLLQATITGTVSDNVGGAGVASVQVSVNGLAALPATITGGTWSFTATGLIATDAIDNNSISVTATDLALPVPGNTSAAVSGTITVDTIAPVVAINAVNPQTNITSQTITGTSIDTNGSSISVSVNGTAQGTTAVTVGGTWSFNVTGLVNGANVIIATATDPAGNSTPSAPATITVDTIPPALTLTAVTTPTKAASQTIGGTVEAGATVTVNGQPAIVTGTTWSFDFALTAPDGAKSITIIATDAATNTTTVNSSITLDTAPPTATISGTPANPSNNKVPILTVAGTQVVSYRWKVDSGAFVGTYSTDTPVSTPIPHGTLIDGSYTVSVIGTDAAGNLQLEANATTVSWTVDTVLPALVLNPVTALTNVNSQTITGTMEAGATVTVNGQPATVTSATTWSFVIGLVEGANAITVTATDAATNVATVTSSITLDTAPPALTLALTAANTPTRITSQTISGTVEAGAEVFVTTNTTAAASHVDIVGTTWSTTIIGLVEGANGITVTATDPAGNTATATQPSSINIVFPNGDLTGDAAVKLEDALKSLQFAAGLIQPTAVEALHADVAPLVNNISSPNGKVDTGDVMLILRKSIGLVNWQINN